eukprot:scaffold56080_cov37-Prasinocladus_malaysianus.AAC.1
MGAIFLSEGGAREGIAIPLALTVWPRSGVVPAQGAQEVSFSLTSFENDSYIHASFEVSLSVLTEASPFKRILPTTSLSDGKSCQPGQDIHA